MREAMYLSFYLTHIRYQRALIASGMRGVTCYQLQAGFNYDIAEIVIHCVRDLFGLKPIVSCTGIPTIIFKTQLTSFTICKQEKGSFSFFFFFIYFLASLHSLLFVSIHFVPFVLFVCLFASLMRAAHQIPKVQNRMTLEVKY